LQLWLINNFGKGTVNKLNVFKKKKKKKKKKKEEDLPELDHILSPHTKNLSIQDIQRLPAELKKQPH